MDPNKTLAILRTAVERFNETHGALEAILAEKPRHEELSDEAAEVIEAAEVMRDAFEALDGWLSRGGFLPTPWARSWVSPSGS